MLVEFIRYSFTITRYFYDVAIGLMEVIIIIDIVTRRRDGSSKILFTNSSKPFTSNSVSVFLSA